MNIGDLVTWKLMTINTSIPLEYGVVIEHFKYKRGCVWVKFVNGQHAHREKTLVDIASLVVVKGTKIKTDKI